MTDIKLNINSKSEELNTKFVCNEIKSVFVESSKIFIGQSGRFIIWFVYASILGHLGIYEYNAAQLSDSIRIVLQAPTMTLILSNLCSQAIGAQNQKLAGIWFQISLIVNLTFAIPLIIVCWNSQNIALQLGIDYQIATLVEYITILQTFALVFGILQNNLVQWFQSQKLFYCSINSQLLGILVQIIVSQPLVFGTGLNQLYPNFNGYGITFLPYSAIISQAIMDIFFLTKQIQIDQLHAKTWPGIKYSNFSKNRICDQLSQHIPAFSTLFLEFWRSSIITQLSYKLDKHEMTVYNLAKSLCLLLMLQLSSYANALSIRINHSLGNRNTILAKQKTWIGLFVLILIFFVLSALWLLFHEQFVLVFSSDELIIDMFDEHKVLMAVLIIFYGLANELTRIANALFKSSWSTFATFISCQFIQIPLSWQETFQNDEKSLEGMFLALIYGYMVQTVILLVVLYYVDWDQIQLQSINRNKKDTKEYLIEISENFIDENEKNEIIDEKN